MVNKKFEEIILNKTNSRDLWVEDRIQELWSGYGNILRYGLEGGDYKSVIVKHIDLNRGGSHPRGWNTDLSHKRKERSYRVEMEWYRSWSERVTSKCPIPGLISITQGEMESLIILEDLNQRGFPLRKASVDIPQIKKCLEFLAYFHMNFINEEPLKLWDIGCYWHLETRPQELERLSDKKLKLKAKEIEDRLTRAKYQTIVHGDAKLANFCFSETGECAMVDFQYVGGGPGVKDVAYFIGSCLYEEDCETYEEELLESYFKSLKTAAIELNKNINIDDLVKEWRTLYHTAWCDFHRFLKGWSPGHWKINSYSERIVREVLSEL